MSSENQKFNIKGWYPIPVTTLESLLSLKITDGEYSYILKKNIAYNLQYLEFLSKLISELSEDMTSVVYKQNCKIFVVISASIIEGILFNEVFQNDLVTKDEWSLLRKFNSTGKIEEFDKDFKLETHVYKKVDPRDIEMRAIDMVQKLEAKKLFQNIDYFYKNIRWLIKKRNKIHIQSIEDSYINTDWNNFSSVELYKTKYILLDIFKKYFSFNDQIIKSTFYYLVLDESQLDLIKNNNEN